MCIVAEASSCYAVVEHNIVASMVDGTAEGAGKQSGWDMHELQVVVVLPDECLELPYLDPHHEVYDRVLPQYTVLPHDLWVPVVGDTSPAVQVD